MRPKRQGSYVEPTVKVWAYGSSGRIKTHIAAANLDTTSMEGRVESKK